MNDMYATESLVICIQSYPETMMVWPARKETGHAPRRRAYLVLNPRRNQEQFVLVSQDSLKVHLPLYDVY